MHSYPDLMQVKNSAGCARMARAEDEACEIRTEGQGRRVDTSDGARVTAEWQGSHYS